MSITIEIEASRLDDPKVAAAVAAVMLALEGRDPEARPAPAAPKAAAPVAAAPKAGTGAAKGRKGAARAPRAAANAAPADPEVVARYRAFVEGLPERSRGFLELLEARGVLTMSEAAAELGIDEPKALGGLTGSIGRWAPVRGVPVPFSRYTEDGEKSFRWIGLGG